jgi:hypothetical protein
MLRMRRVLSFLLTLPRPPPGPAFLFYSPCPALPLGPPASGHWASKCPNAPGAGGRGGGYQGGGGAGGSYTYGGGSYGGYNAGVRGEGVCEGKALDKGYGRRGFKREGGVLLLP